MKNETCINPQKVKLAIIVDTLKAGGVSKALFDFIKCLNSESMNITLYVREFETTSEFNFPDGIVCRKWPVKYSYSEGIIKEGVLRYNKTILLEKIHWRNFGKKKVYQARRYKTIEEEYDCAIAYQMIANDVTIIALEKIKARRRILWLHGRKNFKDGDLQFYNKIYSKADLIVAVSKETEERFAELMPGCYGKTTTIHNFFDFNKIVKSAGETAEGIETAEGEYLIVSVGRLSKEKGFDRVPPVAKKLMDEGYRIKWYIVGDGNKRENIADSIKSKGLEKAVFLTGYLENPYPYINSCDIYVQPSYTEGYCTSTMEAKILRKPVVTTDVPGMKEQFDNGYDGLIVDSSEEGICAGIKSMIDDRELYESIVEHLKSESFSNDSEINKTMEAITGEGIYDTYK